MCISNRSMTEIRTFMGHGNTLVFACIFTFFFQDSVFPLFDCALSSSIGSDVSQRGSFSLVQEGNRDS